MPANSRWDLIQGFKGKGWMDYRPNYIPHRSLWCAQGQFDLYLIALQAPFTRPQKKNFWISFPTSTVWCSEEAIRFMSAMCCYCSCPIPHVICLQCAATVPALFHTLYVCNVLLLFLPYSTRHMSAMCCYCSCPIPQVICLQCAATVPALFHTLYVCNVLLLFLPYSTR